MANTLIKYKIDGEWNGFSLKQREDGLWLYECWTQIEGDFDGRVELLRWPKQYAGLEPIDKADMDTRIMKGKFTKFDVLRLLGKVVRVVRRGNKVRI